MLLLKDFENSEITVSQLSQFSSHTFSVFSAHDFAVLDVNDVAEKIAYNEEKNELGEKYYTDVNLRGAFRVDGTQVTVVDTVKGILTDSDGSFVIDVVKSLRYPLNKIGEEMYFPWIVPAKCSAYLLLKARSLENVSIRLIFVHTETLEKRKITLTFTKEELQEHFSSLLFECLHWNKLYSEHIKSRTEKLSQITFPFENLRDGQETIIKEVSASINTHRSAYINAPTGIGKTVATLYPAFQALAEEKTERIFYLTSRNSLHSVVFDACKKMCNNAVRVLSVVSKNKLCPSGKCDRRRCALVKNHDTRLKQALYDIVSQEYYITTDIIKSCAEKHSVCPFELARLTSQFSDVVICDYNYIFDPYVSSVNLFSAKSANTLLIDEAHNLVERVKGMYSSHLSLFDIQKLSCYFKGSKTTFHNSCESLIKLLNNSIENDVYTAEPLDKTAVEEIAIETSSFFSSFQELVKSREFHTMFSENSDLCENDVLKIFADTKKFIHLCDIMDDSFISFFDENKILRITLADTGKIIKKTVRKIGSAVFFSATLAPEEYYRHMLGAANKDAYINLPSPFSKDNFKVISYNLSTRYSERASTLFEVVEVVYSAVKSKKGNYIVFLPSYSYMSSVVQVWSERYPEIETIAEHSGMKSFEKEEFLSRFTADTSLVAFAVMGGNFSEGVDLAGDKLSGAVIVGLGVLPPQRSRELVAAYFNDRFFDGAKFAYMYPGMNKVFQAGGRVIRSESDKGFLVVIDDRFLTEDYVEHLPDFWQNIARAKNAQKVEEILQDFW